MSNLASYALLRFEINVRASSIVGFVGAGGIGQDLFVAIRKFYYTDVSAILLLIILVVAIMDVVTERIRHRLSPVETTAWIRVAAFSPRMRPWCWRGIKSSWQSRGVTASSRSGSLPRLSV
jgi:hypothetical protein